MLARRDDYNHSNSHPNQHVPLLYAVPRFDRNEVDRAVKYMRF